MHRTPRAAFLACGLALSASTLFGQPDSLMAIPAQDGDAIFSASNRSLAVSNILLFARSSFDKTIQYRLARERAIQEFRTKISNGTASDGSLLIVTIGAPSDSLNGLTPVVRIGDYGVFGVPNMDRAEVDRIEKAVMAGRDRPDESGLWRELNKNDVGGASDLASQMNRTPPPGSAAAFPRSTPGSAGQLEYREYRLILGAAGSRIGSALAKAVDIVYEPASSYRVTDPAKTVAMLATKRAQNPNLYFLALLPASSPRSVFNGLVPLARIGDHVVFAPGDIPAPELRDLEHATAVGICSSAVLVKAKNEYFSPQLGGPAEARQLLAATPEGPIYEKPIDPPPPRRKPGEVDPPKGKDIIDYNPSRSAPPPSGPTYGHINMEGGPKFGVWPDLHKAERLAKQKEDQKNYKQRLAERAEQNKIKKAEWQARARAEQAAVLKWSNEMLKNARDTKNAAIVAREEWVASWVKKSNAVTGRVVFEDGRYYVRLKNNTPLLLAATFRYGESEQSLNWSGASGLLSAYGETSVELLFIPPEARRAVFDNLKWAAALQNYLQW